MNSALFDVLVDECRHDQKNAEDVTLGTHLGENRPEGGVALGVSEYVASVSAS